MNEDLPYTVHERLTMLIRPHVLAIFREYTQDSFFKREAGGQLFGYFDSRKLIIDLATTPKKGDQRSRFSFLPNRPKEQKEIDEKFSEGLHYLGDWHTHPQNIPAPSRSDIRSIEECTRESIHELDGFIMIIVGNDSYPGGLYVSFSDGRRTRKLNNRI